MTMSGQTDHLVRSSHGWWNTQPAYPSPTGQHNAPPPAPLCTNSVFLHPGCNAPANLLFSLPAIDIAGISSTPRVHHGTDLTACRIVAFNRPGRLSTTLAAPSPTDKPLGWDVVLTERQYFYHLDADPDNNWARPVLSER